MIKFFFTFCILTSSLLSQNILHNSENIKLFADYLFCEKDYLRAAEEYQKYLLHNFNDTVNIKVAISYARIENYKLAEEKLSSISEISSFIPYAIPEFYKMVFLQKDYLRFREIYLEHQSYAEKDFYKDAEEMFYSTYFFSEQELPEKKIFIQAFPESTVDKVEKFYNWKNDPPYKSPVLAGVLSAIVPGAGKVYTENYSDGITALILTGLFGYLSYANFEADHNFRGWLFGGISALFYAGNIYGSAASAQIFNAGIKYNFEREINVFLNEHNYFIPEIEFCK